MEQCYDMNEDQWKCLLENCDSFAVVLKKVNTAFCPTCECIIDVILLTTDLRPNMLVNWRCNFCKKKDDHYVWVLIS